MSERRSRNHALISYLSKAQIESVLQKHIQDTKDFAFICHDKDLKDDCSPKETHFHIVFHLFNPKSYDVVRSWFYDDDINPDKLNTLTKPVIDIKSTLLYLTHKNAPEKYQYDISDIVTNNPDWLNQPDEETKDSKSLCIVRDLLEGVSLYDLACRYGREFIINHNQYLDFVSLVRTENYKNDS